MSLKLNVSVLDPNYPDNNNITDPCSSAFNGDPNMKFNPIIVGVIIILAVLSFILNSGVIFIIGTDTKLQAHQPNIGRNIGLFLSERKA